MPAACCRSIRDNDDARAAGTPAAAARAVKAAATASDAGRDPERRSVEPAEGEAAVSGKHIRRHGRTAIVRQFAYETPTSSPSAVAVRSAAAAARPMRRVPFGTGIAIGPCRTSGAS